MNQPNPTIRCTKCGATNRNGARFCNNCGQPLPKPGVVANKQETHSSSNRWLLWAGGAIVALVLLGVCGVGGWTVYRKLTDAQATPSLVQNTSTIPPTIVVTEEITATVVPNTPVPTVAALPCEILFAIASNPGTWDIYVSDCAGKNPALLANNNLANNNIYMPQGGFSPDGQWLYFTKNDEIQSTLYVADVDGSNLQPLVSVETSYLTEGTALSGESSIAIFDGFVYNRRTGQVFALNSNSNYQWFTEKVVDLAQYSFSGTSYNNQWLLLTDIKYADSVMDMYSLLNVETGEIRVLGEFGKNLVALSRDGSYFFAAGCVEDETMSCQQGSIYDVANDKWHILPLEWSGFQVELRPYHWPGTQVEFFPDTRYVLLNQAIFPGPQMEAVRFDTETGIVTPYISGDSSMGIYISSALDAEMARGEFLPPVYDRVLLGTSKTYIANKDGSDLEVFMEQDFDAFLVGENHIIFETDNRTYTVIQDLGSGSQQRAPISIQESFLFSPDKTKFLINQADNTGNRIELWLVDLDTTTIRRIGSETSIETLGGFSSDGTRIVFSETLLNSNGDEQTNLYVTDLEGYDVQFIRENAIPVTPELW